MSKRVVRYIGMFHKEINHSKNSDNVPEVSWVGVVPDLGNVSSFAGTLEEAIYNTKEACELYCDGLIQEIKQPSNLEEIMLIKWIKKTFFHLFLFGQFRSHGLTTRNIVKNLSLLTFHNIL